MQDVHPEQGIRTVGSRLSGTLHGEISRALERSPRDVSVS